MTKRPHFVIIGEAMLELSGAGEAVALGETMRLGQGGDTLNTAIGLARQDCHVEYVTALGMDAWSDAMLANWRSEGLHCDHVLRHPHRRPGLYAIRTDAQGERNFDYWRAESAARDMFALPGIAAALTAAARADWLFLSGITLSILPKTARQRLIALAREVKARGGQVAFDPNYRPAGWADAQAAKAAFDAFAAVTDVALPTRSDEDLLHAGLDLTGHLARWKGLGVETVILKDGAAGCHALSKGQAPIHVAAVPPRHVVDTTGAGDAFNAGSLAALATGTPLAAALNSACRQASHVIAYRGAIPPRTEPSSVSC